MPVVTLVEATVAVGLLCALIKAAVAAPLATLAPSTAAIKPAARRRETRDLGGWGAVGPEKVGGLKDGF
ncbi:MAG TPA: hypothetical protein VGD57_08955 [Candidatus Dormibacteraeota bacterium]